VSRPCPVSKKRGIRYCFSAPRLLPIPQPRRPNAIGVFSALGRCSGPFASRCSPRYRSSPNVSRTTKRARRQPNRITQAVIAIAKAAATRTKNAKSAAQTSAARAIKTPMASDRGAPGRSHSLSASHAQMNRHSHRSVKIQMTICSPADRPKLKECGSHAEKALSGRNSPASSRSPKVSCYCG
jgi:hypothetical protein